MGKSGFSTSVYRNALTAFLISPSQEARVKRLLLGLALVLAATPVFAADAAEGTATTPTFSKDVSRILQQKCQQCHQPNSIAPMSLITYEDVRPWARSIKERVATRQMPPWHIDRSVGVQKF